MTVYGDITPRQAAFSMAGFLTRAIPLMPLERFAQVTPVPKNSTQVAKFRRYFLAGGTGGYSGAAGAYALPQAVTPLTEGVTPAGRDIDSLDVTATLKQYGDWTRFTDVIVDTHEDYPAILRQLMDILGEQAAHTLETLRYGVLKAGTNVFYANGSARTDVNTPLTLALQRKVTRSFKRQNMMHHTSMLASTSAFNTQPIEPAFIGFVHPDVENDIREMAGFINTKSYGSAQALPGEIGSVEDVRYIRSTVFTSFPDAGGAKGTMISTTGTNADVYPIIYVAKDSFGVIPLRGQQSGKRMSMNAASISVVMPKATETDPLAQRGIASWKAWTETVILNDFGVARLEVAATD